MSFTQKLDGLVAKFKELEEKLLDPAGLGNNFAKISKEHSDLQPIVLLVNDLFKKQQELKDSKEMFETIDDKEMRDLLEQEIYSLNKIIPDIEHQIKIALLPKDSADEKNAILEVRAGTGGEEAAPAELPPPPAPGGEEEMAAMTENVRRLVNKVEARVKQRIQKATLEETLMRRVAARLLAASKKPINAEPKKPVKAPVKKK